ncbi:MAG: transcriptional regulator, LysR family [Firmicutes bacterium]|nr:transcriptional regulator, LysR family [Bacillota bacterium]
MDFRQLRYFISVAEHLNFTKAAQHHYITQTAISQQILALENHLGVKLFNRNNRSVQLTNAGKTFLKEARMMLARAEEAVRMTKHAASGVVGSLKIGFLGPNEKRFLPPLIRQFRQKYPNVDFSFHQGTNGAIYEALEHHLLDVAFTLPFYLEKIPNLSVEVIQSDPLCVIFHRDHPLAQKTKIHRSDLAGEPFIVFGQSVSSGGFEAFIQDCVKAGFTPNIVAQPPFLETILLLLDAEIGISILPCFFEPYATPTLRFVELEGDHEKMDLVVAHHVNSDNPTVPLFLQELKDILAKL